MNEKSNPMAARNLAFGENTLALRLVSQLPDLRAGYANRILPS
jgi:hypothetical protein